MNNINCIEKLKIVKENIKNSPKSSKKRIGSL